MQHEPKLVWQSHADSFSQPSQFLNLLSFNRSDRRHRRAQQKRRSELNALECVIKDSLLECLDVNRNVGKFGHQPQINADLRGLEMIGDEAQFRKEMIGDSSR